MRKTSIGWTTFSANPLKYRVKATGEVVWACVHASPGCIHCYAEAIALRYERGKLFNVQNMQELEPFLDDKDVRKMMTARVVDGVPVAGKMCFTGDMTDLFGEWVSDALLDRLFAAFALRRDVTWQILTKRAERLRQYLSAMSTDSEEYRDRWDDARRWLITVVPERREYVGVMMADQAWPLPNVWLGVSVEEQHFADERIPHLLKTPAAVRFISAEPLLGAIDLRNLAHREDWHIDALDTPNRLCRLHWVIVGGESGVEARPVPVGAITSIVEQCITAGVPCYVKQDWGSKPGLQGHIPAHIWAVKQFPAVAA